MTKSLKVHLVHLMSDKFRTTPSGCRAGSGVRSEPRSRELTALLRLPSFAAKAKEGEKGREGGKKGINTPEISFEGIVYDVIHWYQLLQRYFDLPQPQPADVMQMGCYDIN